MCKYEKKSTKSVNRHRQGQARCAWRLKDRRACRRDVTRQEMARSRQNTDERFILNDLTDHFGALQMGEGRDGARLRQESPRQRPRLEGVALEAQGRFLQENRFDFPRKDPQAGKRAVEAAG